MQRFTLRKESMYTSYRYNTIVLSSVCCSICSTKVLCQRPCSTVLYRSITMYSSVLVLTSYTRVVRNIGCVNVSLPWCQSKQANVHLYMLCYMLQVMSPTHIQVLVWERGNGITKACGTGACACVVAGTYILCINRHYSTAVKPSGYCTGS